MADSYGIAFDMPESIRPLYARLGHDVPRINGTGNWRLPLPASFIIGSDGCIVLARAEIASWRRLDPDDAIAAVRQLSTQAAEIVPS